jgi:hypothetical protein
MLFELLAPQGLECPAAAVQSVHFGKIAIFTQQITEYDFAGHYARVFCHQIPLNKSSKQARLNHLNDLNLSNQIDAVSAKRISSGRS